MKRVFDAHGDRTNKHRARLRYVLDRVGESEFVKLYKTQLDKIRQEDLHAPDIRQISSKSNAAPSLVSGAGSANGYDDWRKTNVEPEKVQGEFTVTLRLGLGNIPAEDLAEIASLAQTVGEGFARTTQSQDLLLGRVPEDNLPLVFERLAALKTDVLSTAGPKMVACAGASTCRVGLCMSRGLAEAITSELAKTDWPVELINQAVRISGCPNSCGQHYISPIGLQGRAKRLAGKLLPCYAVLTGGLARQGRARLAEQLAVLPAKNVPVFISAVLSLLLTRKKARQSLESAVVDLKEDIKELAAGYSHIPSIDEQPQMYRDFGCSSAFSLAGRGPGECGAGVMDVIRLDIDQAKEALANARAASDLKSKSDALYSSVVAAARSLLITRGLEPKKDREIFAAFAEHLVEPGWLRPQTKDLLDRALDYRLADVNDIANLVEPTAQMILRVEELFRSLDAKLNFQAKPMAKEQRRQKPTQTGSHVIDLRGVDCPLNFVKAKLELEKIPVGETLEVWLDPGEPLANVPASFTEQGQEVLEITKCDEYFCLNVRKIH
jgi:sulfite reductase (ferredoxin)